MDLLENIFLSKARAGILKKLFLERDREYYLRELERETGVTYKALHTDIHRMQELDLISMRVDGNRNYFKANTKHPLFEDFHSIANKVYGPIPKLKELFEKQNGIESAFIFGSYAKGETHAGSDLDLFIIGDISVRKLSNLLWEAQKEITYEINDHIYTKKDFKAKRNKDHFLKSLKDTEKIFLKGNEDEFKEILS
ncbi:MAG: hypothetical protein CME69_06020 [Halobacteriovorax sp.]|nr:hypothetical protein [Halobacteriovorax sp.]